MGKFETEIKSLSNQDKKEFAEIKDSFLTENFLEGMKKLGITNFHKFCMPAGASLLDTASAFAYAAQTGLSPIAKELYFIPFKGKITPIVGRGGYLRKLREREDYLYHKTGVITKNAKGEIIKHESNLCPEEDEPYGAWAEITFYRKDIKREYTASVSYSIKTMPNFVKAKKAWANSSIHWTIMATKTVLVRLIREYISVLQGSYTLDEIHADPQEAKETLFEVVEEEPVKKAKKTKKAKEIVSEPESITPKISSVGEHLVKAIVESGSAKTFVEESNKIEEKERLKKRKEIFNNPGEWESKFFALMDKHPKECNKVKKMLTDAHEKVGIMEVKESDYQSMINQLSQQGVF